MMNRRGVLFWKKRAEEALQRSGLDYTIVRPGVPVGIGYLKAGDADCDPDLHDLLEVME